MKQQLPEDWRRVMAPHILSDYYAELERFVAEERQRHDVYPPDAQVFCAFRYTSFDSVRVVIVGQDPYHDEGQAHGLCFSVPKGVRRPPSLANIVRELETDMGCNQFEGGCLTPWARQGVLLLNTVLTVRAHAPNSHRNRGWERFTDGVIAAVNQRDAPCVFLLWGAFAQRKAAMLDTGRHTVIESAHPSPLSARTGFFGSRPFSRTNTALAGCGLDPIDWCNL